MKIFGRTFKTLLFFTLLGGLLWSAGFGWFAFQASSIRPYDVNQKADAIVVLTGGEGRLDTGLNLFAAKRGLYLFITSVYEQISEDDIRARWKGATPLPICCIFLDREADTTAQNALMARQWVEHFAATSENEEKITSIRLVTSNYHMPRALIDFKRILPDVTVYPHPIISPNARKRDKTYWLLLLQEYHKYLFRIAQQKLPPKWQEAAA
ncbi:MAG: hypothetical protein CL570_01355 [Alphaproteobacteria bacterium]|nr:hypothetical protein [Alphaproteobacteria bacterium]|tara:strand:- start:95829 stop:96458 length:630 start_codon:yes stop_codon:yes gene_type:complete